MQRFRNILVGIDLSSAERLADFELTAPNEQALRWSIWLAGHTRGALTIFSSLDIPPHAKALLEEEMPLASSDLERDAAEILERFVAQAKSEGVDAQKKIAIGTSWKAICRQVVAEKHDLVVVGTRDLGNAGRILFGSTGMKLLRNCPCPVWVTRPDPNWDDLNILVPSDFSELSLEALRIAVNGGQLVETRLHVLHALESHMSAPAWFGGAQKEIVERSHATQCALAEKQLHDQLAQTDYRTLSQGVQVHVVDGPPEEAILKAIDDYQIDLVVMGTSGRSGLAGFVIGNTAERMISHMKCSVIAVKPSGFHCPVEPED